MGLDDTASKGEKQKKEEANRKSDAPGQGANGLLRFLAVSDEIIECGAKAEDYDQEDQDDNDFQGGS